MRQLQVTSTHFVETEYPYIIICKNSWKWWIISKIHKRFFHLERVETGEKNWETKILVIGHGATELKPYCRQWNLTLNVSLEIFPIRSWAFCTFWPYPRLSRSSVTTVRWPDTIRSFWGKIWWKSVAWCRGYSKFFSVFDMTHFLSGNGD